MQIANDGLVPLDWRDANVKVWIQPPFHRRDLSGSVIASVLGWLGETRILRRLRPVDGIVDSRLHLPDLGQRRLEIVGERIDHGVVRVHELGQVRLHVIDHALQFIEGGHGKPVRRVGTHYILGVDEPLGCPPDVFPVVVKFGRSVLVQRPGVIGLGVFIPLIEEMVSSAQVMEYSLVSQGRVLRDVQRFHPT